MGKTPSIRDQVCHALGAVRYDDETIARMKRAVDGRSIKPALRGTREVTAPLRGIVSYGTMQTYGDAATTFFRRCREISGHKLLAQMLDPDLVKQVMEEYYRDAAPGHKSKVLCAVQKVWQGCRRLGWTKEPNPVTEEVREYVKTLSEYGQLRVSRYGYAEGDAERIIAYFKERGSPFYIPARLARECGLRLSEVTFLKGKDVDKEKGTIRVRGKGGRIREVSVPSDLMRALNPSKQYLFGASQSWRRAFQNAVADAARNLGIEASGVHRMRANYAQELYRALRARGLSDREARRRVARALGHNRTDVTGRYIPRG